MINLNILQLCWPVVRECPDPQLQLQLRLHHRCSSSQMKLEQEQRQEQPQMQPHLDATCCGFCRCCRLLSICIKNVLHFIWPRPASASMGKRPNWPNLRLRASRKNARPNKSHMDRMDRCRSGPWLLLDFFFIFAKRLSKLHTKLF